MVRIPGLGAINRPQTVVKISQKDVGLHGVTYTPGK